MGLLVSHTFSKLTQHISFWVDKGQQNTYKQLLNFFSRITDDRIESTFMERSTFCSISHHAESTWALPSWPGEPLFTNSKRRDDQDASGEAEWLPLLIFLAFCF